MKTSALRFAALAGLAVLAAACSSSSSGGAVAGPSTSASVPTSTPTVTPTHHHSHHPSASPTTTVTVTATPSPSTAPCATSQLKLSYGISQGTAGTTYQVLVFTNTGSSPCTLFGYPGVSFLDANGAIIGKPSSRDHGAEHTITLAASGGQANALSRLPDVGNFAASACQPKKAKRIRVYPPNQTAALFLHDSGQVCSTSAGRTGIGPVRAGNGG